MELVFIVWPFALFLTFLVYGIYAHFKDRRILSGIKLKVAQLGGGVEIRPLSSVFSKDSLVSGFVDDTDENATFYSFVKSEFLVSVSYIDKFIGWVVTSTVIQIKSPVFDGMNIVVLSESLPSYSKIDRKLRARGATFVTLDDLDRVELTRYRPFVKYLFSFKAGSKIDFYDGHMSIVVGNFLKSNMLSYEQIDHILDLFIKEQLKT